MTPEPRVAAGRLALVVFALALALRLLPLGHGLPGLYVPDSHGVRNALGIAKDRDLVPRANEYSSYPYLFSYACLPLFAADFALARASGRAPTMEAYREDAERNLARFHLLARGVAAVCGAAAAGLATVAAATLSGRRAAAFAGLLAALSPMSLLLSVHERPWSMVLAFTSLSIAAAAAALRPDARSRPLLLSALAAGAAGGAHQVGAGALAIPVAAALLRTGATLGGRAAALAGVVAAFAAGFLAGNPYLVRFGPGGAVATNLTEATAVSVGGQGLAMKFDARHTAEALGAFLSMETLVPLLAVAGAVVALRAGGLERRGALALLAFAAPVVALCLAYTGTHARYFAVALPAAWVLAGAALARIERAGIAGRAAAAACVAVPLVLAARLDRLLLREDTREEARRWIEERVPAGARIAVEPYGPQLRASAESLREVAAVDPELLTRRERIAADRGEPGGHRLLPLERAFEDPGPDAYRTVSKAGRALYPGAATPREIVGAAGCEWLVRVDRFPSRARADGLAALADERGELVLDVSPAGSGAPPREAMLPFEPRTGALALFSVERPGPRVRVYRLRK